MEVDTPGAIGPGGVANVKSFDTITFPFASLLRTR